MLHSRVTLAMWRIRKHLLPCVYSSHGEQSPSIYSQLKKEKQSYSKSQSVDLRK